jgi:hypothetical protein
MHISVSLSTVVHAHHTSWLFHIHILSVVFFVISGCVLSDLLWCEKYYNLYYITSFPNPQCLHLLPQAYPPPYPQVNVLVTFTLTVCRVMYVSISIICHNVYFHTTFIFIQISHMLAWGCVDSYSLVSVTKYCAALFIPILHFMSYVYTNNILCIVYSEIFLDFFMHFYSAWLYDTLSYHI